LAGVGRGGGGSLWAIFLLEVVVLGLEDAAALLQLGVLTLEPCDLCLEGGDPVAEPLLHLLHALDQALLALHELLVDEQCAVDDLEVAMDFDGLGLGAGLVTVEQGDEARAAGDSDDEGDN